MTQSPACPTGSDAFLAVCGHTHLFPGARCRLRGLPDPHAFARAPRPVELELRFSDDVVAEARLRTEDRTGAVLAVPAYTTGAGTSIGSRTWLVREFARTGDEVELTIGGHAGGGSAP
ncbi:hypothetical protein [Streptomyces subrutilus]|nr:hypothetical protein [Streptomyces subrutilus]QEU77558.1 hypothetical protein CP968_03990 [Streptomyces subrutilus]WSJ33349.1 hypothetical protein OG479_30850 [Streptomyces subrutilus]